MAAMQGAGPGGGGQGPGYGQAPSPAYNPASRVATPPTGALGQGIAAPSKKRGRPTPAAAAAAAAASTGAVANNSYKVQELAPAARRKKRKVQEKQLPERIAALLPESGIYTQLLEFEARVDAALTRKKLDIQEAVSLHRNPPRIQRTLRMYIFNTYHYQSHEGAQNLPGGRPQDGPSWNLRIMGRLLDEAGGDLQSSGAQSLQLNQQRENNLPKFSSFFKKITVNLEPTLYPENHTIIWDGARTNNQVEGFEIKRKGDKEFNVKIKLEMSYSPERFKLSQGLAELVGVEVDTRPRIIAAIWQYIKGKKLQNPADPTVINCDPPLRKILGEDNIKFAYVAQKLHPHLSPPQPIQLEHRIKVSGRNPAGQSCYDVSVDVPAPLQKEMNNFLANIEKHKDIDNYDDIICSSIKKINEHRKRRAFFLGFSHSPVDFINGLIASQSRDLKMVSGQPNRNAEKERRSDFYNQPWVEDAVIRYLNRRPQKGNEGAGNA